MLFFYSMTFIYPTLAYDPLLDYYRLKKTYVWLQPYIYYIIYQELLKYPNTIITSDDICAIIQYESGNACHNNVRCMQYVHSSAGAIGFMQIMPFHHNGPSSDLYIPEKNIYYGIRYYYYCVNLAKGNKKEALRYYNAGPKSNREKYRNWNNYVMPILYIAQRSANCVNEALYIK